MWWSINSLACSTLSGDVCKFFLSIQFIVAVFHVGDSDLMTLYEYWGALNENKENNTDVVRWTNISTSALEYLDFWKLYIQLYNCTLVYMKLIN